MAAAGGGNIVVWMTRLDGDQDNREKNKFLLAKTTTVAALRARIQMEFGIEPHEQCLMFRGRLLERDKDMPLSTPDLHDIIAEAGEKGLQMAFSFQKKQVPGYLKKYELEEMNDKLKTGAYALHRAARQSQINVMEELLSIEDFAGVNACDKSGQTALHIAVASRLRETSETMLSAERFRLVGLQDESGQTALHLAAHWGDLKVCQMILDHKEFKLKDGLKKDINERTALDYARDCGHLKVAKLIEERCPADAVIPDSDPEEEDDDEEAMSEGNDEELASPEPESTLGRTLAPASLSAAEN